jgi:DNA-binding response OmpR family regulator
VQSEKTILVVDDDPSIRLLCRLNLELEGFRVLEAATLAVARGHLERDAIDAVLLDLHVGPEDSSALLRELRDSGVGVALLTGSVDLPAVDTALVDAVVAKPFSLETLTATVRRLANVASCI